MRWLKQTISIALLLAAFGIAVATGFSEHSDDYGRVPLPQGGTVHLPEGEVTVFYRVQDQNPGPADRPAGLSFQVAPAGGGTAIAIARENGETSGVAVTRSETIGELGSIAKLDVPTAGDYVVSGSTGLAPGSSGLEFGTNAGAALLKRWKLIAGLVLGAILIALIPVPRSGRRWDDGTGSEPAWSSDPRAPYAG